MNLSSKLFLFLTVTYTLIVIFPNTAVIPIVEFLEPDSDATHTDASISVGGVVFFLVWFCLPVINSVLAGILLVLKRAWFSRVILYCCIYQIILGYGYLFLFS
jgi:hypothetical protein